MVFESNLEQRVEVHKAGRNVATSQRQNVPTSLRPNVVTSQLRDVPTSRRRVNKKRSQQAVSRDISAIFSFPSLKAKRGPEIKASKDVQRRARNQFFFSDKTTDVL